jgi:hypothetical protein
MKRASLKSFPGDVRYISPLRMESYLKVIGTHVTKTQPSGIDLGNNISKLYLKMIATHVTKPNHQQSTSATTHQIVK